MAGPDFPDGKFCFFPLWSLWPLINNGRHPPESLWHSQQYDRSQRRVATQIVQVVQQGAVRRRHILFEMFRRAALAPPQIGYQVRTGPSGAVRITLDYLPCASSSWFR